MSAIIDSSNSYDADAPQPQSTIPGGRMQGAGSPVAPAPQQERDAVARWLSRINVVQRHDEERHKQYAIDRKYGRGDSSFDIRVPVIPTFIDKLVDFIYARDPDVDANPARHVQGSDIELIRQVGKSIEAVIPKLWKRNGLKRKAKRMVRSALTVGIGWLKITWQEDFATDPVLTNRSRDLTDNMAELQALVTRLGTDPGCASEIQERMQALTAGMTQEAERRITNGLGIAFIRPEDIVVSLDADTVVDCDTGSWMAERWFMPVDDAVAKWANVIPEEEIRKAAVYGPRKPTRGQMISGEEAVEETSADQSSAYVRTAVEGAKFICGYEVWDAATNTLLDVIEGIDRYAHAPQPPNVVTTRFFPYVPYAVCEVDGERHPQSLVQRSASLADELDRSRSALRQHRSRIRPKLLFDATTLSVASAKKLEGGVTAEMVGIKLIGGKKSADVDMTKLLVPVQYPQVDMALYDTTYVKQDLEMTWGIQEALTGVTVQKTATESEIQQSGTQASNGSKRDTLEDVMTTIAQMTVEMAARKLTDDEVRQLAGSNALWYEAESIDELDQLINLEIRGGSTGQAGSSARQQAWAALLPELKGAIEKIAQLRNANPLELAQAIENLVLETFSRVGDNTDATRFIPQQGQPTVLIDPQSGMAIPAYPAMGAGAAMPGGAAASAGASGAGSQPAQGQIPPVAGGDMAAAEQQAPTAVPGGL